VEHAENATVVCALARACVSVREIVRVSFAVKVSAAPRRKAEPHAEEKFRIGEEHSLERTNLERAHFRPCLRPVFSPRSVACRLPALASPTAPSTPSLRLTLWENPRE
jgi:hypothetical protein